MSQELLIALMFICLIAGILAGGHLAFVLGGLAVVFGLLGWGPQAFSLFVQRMHVVQLNYVLSAIPLFVFMGYVIEKARIAEDVFHALELYFRRVRGGLAIATTGVCAVLGMCTGIVATSIIAAGVLAIPPMFKRGYNKEMVLGTVAAGGTLGILIPPSIMLIFYAAESGLSAGALFAAAFGPGFMLASLYALYIWTMCHIRPSWAPLPEITGKVPAKEYVVRLKGILPVMVLIAAVLGVIMLGIATPTEASGTGAFAALLIALAYRRFSWKMLKESAFDSLNTMGMIGLILIAANCYSTVFLGMGGQKIVTDLLMNSGLSPLGILAVMLGIILISVLLSVITAQIVPSAPVPAVVGMAIAGTPGFLI